MSSATPGRTRPRAAASGTVCSSESELVAGGSRRALFLLQVGCANLLAGQHCSILLIVVFGLSASASSNTHIPPRSRFSLFLSAIPRYDAATEWVARALAACYASCDPANEKGFSIMTNPTDASPDRSALVYHYHERLYRLALLTVGNADTAALLLQQAYCALPATAGEDEAP